MKEYNSKKSKYISGRDRLSSENMSTADVDAVMKKYDRESNIRIWTGKYKIGYPRNSHRLLTVVYLCNTYLQPSWRKSD